MVVHDYDAQVLVPTTTKTSAYTAAVNDLVIVDGTSSSVVITLPTAPPDRSSVGVKRLDATFTPANTPTIAVGGSDAFLGGSTTALQLPLQGQVSILQYSSSRSQWIVRSTDEPLSQLDSRYQSAVAASIVPAANITYNLGSPSEYWSNLYVYTVNLEVLLQLTTSTVTAAGTTTLAVTSSQVQIFTGSTTQTVLLPTTSVPAGYAIAIINQSSGALTIQSSGGNTIATMAANSRGVFQSQKATPTAQNDWSGAVFAQGKAFIVNNSLTLAGTDGTIMTFPSTSATIARTDAANTFTGHQTIEGVTSTGATGTGNLVFATSPTLVTPALGTPASGTLTNCTGLPLTGLTSGSFGDFCPADYSWISWAYDPITAYAGAIIPIAGTMYCTLIPIRVGVTVTNIIMYVQTAGATLTSGQNFAGLFNSSGTLLSATADQSTSWQSTGLKTMALATPQTVTAGLYFVGFFSNGTTLPKFTSNGIQVANDGANSGSSYRFGADGVHTGLTTAFHTPATISGQNTGWWAAVS